MATNGAPMPIEPRFPASEDSALNASRQGSTPPRTPALAPSQPASPSTAVSPAGETPAACGPSPEHAVSQFTQPAPSVPLPKSTAEASVTPLDGNGERRRSSASPTAETHIHPLTVIAMVLGLVVGIGSAAALYGYYTSLNGTPVGSTDDQQRALRVGTALAFFAQVGLVYSIHKAYVQWLWRELKNRTVSFQGIDAAFAAASDPLSFANVEMLRSVKVGSSLAFVAWFIPISSLIAPATLNIHPVMQDTGYQTKVPTLDVSQASQYENFAYAVNGTPQTAQKYLGPRTIIGRFAVAAATTGEILSLPQLSPNASYEQTFFGPYVQCNNSTAEVQVQINGMIARYNQSLGSAIQLMSLDYFAAIPALSNADASVVQAANLSEIDGAAHASNQLWIYYTSYAPSLEFSNPVTSYYLTCELYNASYTTQFTWKNGVQNLTVSNRTLNNAVPYPANASTDASSEDAMSYSAVMWALSKQLTGSIAFVRDVSAEDATLAGNVYSDIATDLAQTVLIGSSDFNSHFIENHLLGLAASGNASANGSFSTQRLLDMAYAHNNTLAYLIQQLSSNVTLSLFSDPILAYVSLVSLVIALLSLLSRLLVSKAKTSSPALPQSVTLTAPINLYSFQSHNVLLAYCVAGFVAIVANILGFYAIWTSHESHDVSFSSIVCSTSAIHLGRLRVHERLGVLPLPKTFARTRLKFYYGDGRWGWGSVDEREG
jgi:hypothetical protein